MMSRLGLPLDTLDRLNQSGEISYGTYSTLHDQVSVLVDAIDDAPHDRDCPLDDERYRGRLDRWGTFPACACWKAEIDATYALYEKDDHE
jgi:hypothetical protein